MEIVVVGQPVPKARPRVTYKGGRAWAYTPKEVRDYQQLVASLAFNERAGRDLIPRDIPVRLRVTFVLQGKGTSRPDLVNLASAIADALEGVCYEDDAQIAELQCRKRQGDHPRAMISVEALTPLNARPSLGFSEKGD